MGKITELKTTTLLVKEILKTVPETRSNDKLLYYRLCEKKNNLALSMPFGMVLLNLDEFRIPSIETVGRCRRKLQEQHPELRANSNVEAGRMLNEEAFREYARGEV